METQDRIWLLTARKLAGEASAEELEELAELLAGKPELHIPIEWLNAVWKMRDTAEDCNPGQQTGKIWDRIRRSDPEKSTTHLDKQSSMFRNNFKIALRNLFKSKISSFINIAGLAIGMTVAMLIGLWINDELSFNKQFEHYDRIAQVMVKRLNLGAIDINRSLSIPIGTELRSGYKDDFKHVVMTTRTEDYILSNGQNTFTQKGSYMQAEAPDLFSLKMIAGSRSGLADPHSILLSESLARTIFGNVNPLGKLIKVDNNLDVKVTGIYQDLPRNTSFNDLGFILPWDLLVFSNDWYKTRQIDWMDNFLVAYVELNPGVTIEQASARIRDVKRNHISKEQALDKPEAFLHPMSKWHLYSRFENGVSVTSLQLEYVWLYGVIGIFVLLLACINFMNLSTARSEKRAKEVGIRKAIGSGRSQLISQFFSESLLIVVFAFIVSLVLVQ
ncbi:MAG TPA: ABC transporter permease, partial [Chryseolinea sp.]|nr:ABC transporter permease [Chryseolinea sp.]